MVRSLPARLLAAIALTLAACGGPPPASAPVVHPANRAAPAQTAPRTVAQAGAPAPTRSAPAGPETRRTAAEQRAGDASHRKILQEFGGAYDDRRLTAYVERVGRRLAAATPQARQPWRFTVLDTPVINAFATQGGYVYVTRGLIALAGDEAELAGVMGHEMGHIIADHVEQRQEQATIATLGALAATGLAAVLGADPSVVRGVAQAGQLAGAGYVASYSREQELEADRLGVAYLSGAGYDPFAEADFLARMRAQAELSARIQGENYDPTRVDFLSSHPANAERARRAAASAAAGARTGDRDRAAYLAAIDGMTFGDSPDQGYVRGRQFLHPKLRFAFTAPDGFRLVNTPSAVGAIGPGNARLILDGDRDPGGDLTGYIARVWAPEIARQARLGGLSRMQRLRLGGLDAATAFAPVILGGRDFVAQLTVVRHNGRLYRLAGISPARDAGARAARDRAARSFRPLSAAEAAGLRPLRLQVIRSRGESVESLAARAGGFDRWMTDRLRVLNGLPPGGQPRRGEEVKIIVQ